jgi:hypothetical protein
VKRVLSPQSDDCVRVDSPVDEPIQEVKPQSHAIRVNGVNGIGIHEIEPNNMYDNQASAELDAWKRAIDDLVNEFASNFSAPTANDTVPEELNIKKVVLVTGGTGSLGVHLVYHLAQQTDVETVVSQPYTS